MTVTLSTAAAAEEPRKAQEGSLILEGLFCALVLFVAIGSVFPLLRRPHGEGTVLLGAPSPEGAIYLVAYAVCSLLLLSRRAELLQVVRDEPWIWTLPALALLSVIWSTDRALTFRSSISLIGSMLFGAYFGLRFRLQEQLAVVAGVLFTAVVLSVVFIVFIPDLGIEFGAHTGAWRGIFAHKNLFGRVLAFTLLVAAVRLRASSALKPLDLVFLIVAPVLLIKSESRTALATAAVGLAVLAARPVLRRVRAPGIAVGSALATVLAALAWMAWNQRTALLQADASSESFSGRTLLWVAALLKAKEHPLLGYGFFAFWQGRTGAYVDVWKLVHWAAPNAHNAFLDSALDLGIVGALLLFYVSVRAMTIALALERVEELGSAEREWLACLTIFTVASFLSEGQLVGANAYWMLMTAAVVTSTVLLKGASLGSELSAAASQAS